MDGKQKNTLCAFLIGKPNCYVYAVYSEFDKGASVIESLNRHELLLARRRLSTFRQFLALTRRTDVHFSAGFSTGGTEGFSVVGLTAFVSGGLVGAGSDFLQPLNVKATTVRVTITVRTTFLMSLSFQKPFPSIRRTDF